MKWIKLHDESGQYEVHIVPFILKFIFCLFAVIVLVSVAMELPSSIRYDLKYSGKEYYLSNCERHYLNRDYDDLYSTLYVYDLYDRDIYGKYWEIIEAYKNYCLYMNYKNMLEDGSEQVKLEMEENPDEYRGAVHVEVDTQKLCDKYRDLLKKEAAACQYPENERYFKEFLAELD